jgi:hypothetical protein
MSTFSQFLAEKAERGEVINTVFEERLFGLVSVLHKMSGILTAAAIPHELIGGLAVLVHVEEADPEHSTLTRDIDLLVRRADLDRIKVVSSAHGFEYRHAAGVDMLLPSASEDTRNAVHLLFSGEKVSPRYSAPTPAIQPEIKVIQGHEVAVIPVVDLVTMKLTSFRDKDRVHVRAMDAAGLIGKGVEERLPQELIARLRHVRETE